jgi:hypothetical protein
MLWILFFKNKINNVLQMLKKINSLNKYCSWLKTGTNLGYEK